MAAKAENRWIYFAGIGVLATLVVVALVMTNQRDPEGDADGGAASSEDGGADGATADGGAESDGAAGEGGLAVPMATSEAGPAVPPEGASACRTYCQGLSDRGELAAGMDVDGCVARLCQDGGAPGAEEEAPAEAVPTVSGSDTPSNCEAECRQLHSAGELQAGMSVDDCIAALCAD